MSTATHSGGFFFWYTFSVEEHHTPEAKKLAIDLSRFIVVKNNRGSQRGEILDKFLTRLNPSRVQAGFAPLTHPRLCRLLANYKSPQDLYIFFQECEKAGIPFSAYFHWRLKKDKETK